MIAVFSLDGFIKKIKVDKVMPYVEIMIMKSVSFECPADINLIKPCTGRKLTFVFSGYNYDNEPVYLWDGSGL